MDHNDKISLVVEKARESPGHALFALPLDRRNDEPETMIRGIMRMPLRTGLRLCAILHEGFEFFDPEGLRVTLAFGRSGRDNYCPDHVQSWWIPRDSLIGEEGTESSIEEFYTWSWSSTTVTRSKRRITAPAYAQSGRHCVPSLQKRSTDVLHRRQV